jgi:hypothetical protein
MRIGCNACATRGVNRNRLLGEVSLDEKRVTDNADIGAYSYQFHLVKIEGMKILCERERAEGGLLKNQLV